MCGGSDNRNLPPARRSVLPLRVRGLILKRRELLRCKKCSVSQSYKEIYAGRFSYQKNLFYMRKRYIFRSVRPLSVYRSPLSFAPRPFIPYAARPDISAAACSTLPAPAAARTPTSAPCEVGGLCGSGACRASSTTRPTPPDRRSRGCFRVLRLYRLCSTAKP